MSYPTLAKLAAATPKEYPARGGRPRKSPEATPRHRKTRGPHPIVVWLRANPGEHTCADVARATGATRIGVITYARRHPQLVASRLGTNPMGATRHEVRWFWSPV